MKTQTYWTEIPSPLGRLQLRGTATALTALYMEKAGAFPKAAEEARHDAAPFVDIVAQLEQYFAGERRVFEVGLSPAGTEFQRTVWAALRTIEYGRTMSYSAVARQIGRERAVRAVGLANGRNPIAIIIPCHRVIGADGSLTGYDGGLDRKRFLLALEQAAGVETHSASQPQLAFS